jgi:hypothetical protein
MSKGDNRRPRQVSQEEYEENYERTFGKKRPLSDLEAREMFLRWKREEGVTE